MRLKGPVSTPSYFRNGKALQSAAVPFGLARFLVLQSPFAIAVTAQALSNHHAHASPQQGISIRIRSALTALPNFSGQLFWRGIMKSCLRYNESIPGEPGPVPRADRYRHCSSSPWNTQTLQGNIYERKRYIPFSMDTGDGPQKNPQPANNSALKLSELRYRRLFETAQDGILILDGETGKIVNANPFIPDLLGYPLFRPHFTHPDSQNSGAVYQG